MSTQPILPSPLPCRQVSSLTRLKALSVFEASYSDDSMALLARLPRLCSVDFYSCEWLPDCLSRLTGLERLCIDYQTIYARDADALPHLCQLTCLVLEGVTDHDAALAAALPRMPQLRALAWSVLGRHRPNFPGQPVLPPPGGPWLGRLLHLEADPWALEGLLPGATALRELGLDANLNIQTEPEEMMESVAEAARAAVALPALRQLSVYIGPCYGEPDAASPPPPSVLAALAGSRVHLQWIETELSNGSPLKRQFYE